MPRPCGPGATDDDAAYRAMDVLLDTLHELAERIFFSVANLLNLEVDLIFFDATSTYFQTEQADPIAAQTSPAGEAGAQPESEPDAEPDDYAVQAGRRPRPVQGPSPLPAPSGGRHGGDPRWDRRSRAWTFPGNTADQTLIRTARDGRPAPRPPAARRGNPEDLRYRLECRPGRWSGVRCVPRAVGRLG
ncbi:MAG: hypothetical protein M3332_02955, partial [Actinomycetota bacterium]|nr:hypothetical protein [Actinomycetota bacterium]